jgi:hypothetical protein
LCIGQDERHEDGEWLIVHLSVNAPPTSTT